MSVVLCLPAHLRVSTAASRGQAPHRNASLVLSSQSRLLGSNPIVWLCDQKPVKSFQKGPPPKKAKLKRWWTYLSQFRLTVHHIPVIKNEVSDYILRNNFDALIGESSAAPERLSSVWMSNLTCPCALLEFWRVGA